MKMTIKLKYLKVIWFISEPVKSAIKDWLFKLAETSASFIYTKSHQKWHRF